MRRAVKRSSNRLRTCARKFGQPVDGADGALFILHDKAGHAVVDDLGDRTAIECDDRRSARHGLDHDKAERLRPIDRKQQRGCTAQEFRLLAIGDLTNILDVRRRRSSA